MDRLNKIASKMRRSMPEAERIFAHRLKTAKVKYIAQFVIAPYIVDFYLPNKRLVLEIDGTSHLLHAAVMYDVRRTKFLEEKGFGVIRIRNEDVWNFDLDKCEVPKLEIADRGFMHNYLKDLSV